MLHGRWGNNDREGVSETARKAGPHAVFPLISIPLLNPVLDLLSARLEPLFLALPASHVGPCPIPMILSAFWFLETPQNLWFADVTLHFYF